MKIEILRLSHRIQRDPRLSTHVALTARAFLASKLYYSGDKDSSLENSLNKVTKQFGGNFKIEYVKDPTKLIKEKKDYTIVHLTVYGETLPSTLTKLKKSKNLLIIVGGEKVPPEIFQLSDYNVSITSQPISEVSALAIFLHELHKGKELTKKFPKAKIQILPSKKGKKFKK
ncbi:MAG: tRNA (cytidine(56)-2'-O)-methyltransferase [Nanoarchaeota archaeon]|nr:tRNA (cytidine(56)-2'-O)-methyltransferase [Nanoarchaeota archaeon]|tara:strand:+ start:15369 stop:15884 length:516 start_codon:yes stop_codon:yes gene_type:complete